MGNVTTRKSIKTGRKGDSKSAARVRFTATLHRPTSSEKASQESWTFLNLPKQASAKLPSRSKVSVEGTLNGTAFRATLEPDGQGGHWLKVDRKLRESSGADVGEKVTLVLSPVA